MGIFWRNSELTRRLARLIFSQCFGFLPPDYCEMVTLLYSHAVNSSRGGVPLSAELGSSGGTHTSNGALDSNLFL